MPRDSGGTYSLPAGNPVVTLSVISSTWANTTLSDISTALTGSLDRSGQGAMLAGLKLFDGVIGAPGLTWGTDTTSGLYRNGAADFRWSISAVELLRLNTNLIQLSGTAPIFRIDETDAAANNRLWDVIASGEDLNFRVLTDALVATNWLTVARTAGVVDTITLAATTLTVNAVASLTHVTVNLATDPTLALASTLPSLVFNETDAAANNRFWGFRASAERMTWAVLSDDGATATSICEVDRTGTTVDTVNFINGTLQYGSQEVGYRDLPVVSITGNRTLVTDDRGRVVEYSGAGGHTITVPGAGVMADGGLVTVLNSGTGTITLAVTAGGLFWFNGSGTIPNASRTLAIGGVATLRCVNATGSAYVWGTGLS